MKPHTIAAVEIGTATIKVLVGAREGRKLSILGHATRPSRGVVKGAIVDYRAAGDCTHRTITEAEQRAGRPVDRVFLALTGSHIEGIFHQEAIAVKSSDGKVRQRAIDQVRRLASSRELPPGRIAIHHLRRPFFLDGRRISGSPEGRVGRRLEAGCWTVHGSVSKISDALHLVGGCGLPANELLLSGLASSATVTTAADRRRGVLVIDLGAGTTDYALFCHDHVGIAGVLPVGGSHVTNDLALGLRLTAGQAEKLKLRHGRALVSTRNQNEKVWLDGNYAIGDRQYERRSIEQITAARTREIFAVVKKKLGAAFTPETCAAGVVLTGGTALLPAIAACATRVFGVPARLGEPPRSGKGELRDPSFSTTLGLFYYLLSGKTRRR